MRANKFPTYCSLTFPIDSGTNYHTVAMTIVVGLLKEQIRSDPSN